MEMFSSLLVLLFIIKLKHKCVTNGFKNLNVSRQISACAVCFHTDRTLLRHIRLNYLFIARFTADLAITRNCSLEIVLYR